jgi:hypothetical protein
MIWHETTITTHTVHYNYTAANIAQFISLQDNTTAHSIYSFTISETSLRVHSGDILWQGKSGFLCSHSEGTLLNLPYTSFPGKQCNWIQGNNVKLNYVAATFTLINYHM